MTAAQELSSAECARLLRAGDFGRMGLNGPCGPEIVPVTYRVVEEAILVCTNPGSILGSYADGARLVFEIDQLDREYRHGWSVLAHGVGQRVDQDHAGPRLPHPWADLAGRAIIRLPWSELTGRRLGSITTRRSTLA